MIRYEPWHMRGYDGPAYQIYVVNEGKKSLAFLKELKQILNNSLTMPGLYIIENSSPAIKRLGWSEMDENLYYRIIE